MKFVILWREKSDHARAVIEFVEMMRRTYPDKKPEMVELETRRGADVAQYYYVDRYPAVIVATSDGHVLGQWQGLPMPLVDQVMGSVLEAESSHS